MSKNTLTAAVLSALIGLGAGASANAADIDTVIVTATNAAQNALLVYSPDGTLLRTVSTQGKGGVGGNAGGIAVSARHVAVVNFGSHTVSLFGSDDRGGYLRLEQQIPTLSAPVSVAFGHGHLYVLGSSTVESHAIDGNHVAETADGSANLLHADGTSAQVGVVAQRLLVTEKSNAIENVALTARGAVTGSATAVSNLPSTINVPLGFATRGDEAYVTSAHSNQVLLVRQNAVVTQTAPISENAPCWAALSGPYLYTADTPSHVLSRFVVYGNQVQLDAPAAAQFSGGPTDIAASGRLIAVIDGESPNTRVSTYDVDDLGTLNPRGTAVAAGVAANGIGIVRIAESGEHGPAY